MTLRKADRVDWRTLLLAGALPGCYLLWSLCFGSLPLWISAPLGSVLLTWYGSLQHETIHGHPTRSELINTACGALPLSMWLPYAIYRESHRQHHARAGRLTEVGCDPESFYVEPGYLAQAGRIRRALLLANCTLLGRLLLGPAIAIVSFWRHELPRACREPRRRRIWLWHAAGVVLLTLWLSAVCQISIPLYLLLIVYPSVSLTQLRSFAEHGAAVPSASRTNVVEANLFWSLIFMNNNLHVVHHNHPQIPWHGLPQLWRRTRASAGAGRVFAGYREVARSYLLRPFINAEHPLPRTDPDCDHSLQSAALTEAADFPVVPRIGRRSFAARDTA